MITRQIPVPTGDILIVRGDKGSLECVSLGDYGKDNNLKAGFLGLDRDIDKVVHTDLMPLSQKWVVTISTQYGCSMGCVFCDVPKVGPGINASYDDLLTQVEAALSLHPEITYTDRLNIHYARMGEPSYNTDVLRFTRDIRQLLGDRLGDSLIHPVVSTMMPRANQHLEQFLHEWMEIKNKVFAGDAGLQFSVNSTSETERHEMFSGNALSLNEVANLGRSLRDCLQIIFTNKGMHDIL